METASPRRRATALPPVREYQGEARRRPRVLLAEDDAALRALLARLLRQEGCDVIEACDGLDLFSRIEAEVNTSGRKAHSIALVVSDIRMPGLSGLEVLSILRCGFWDTPVILLTAFGDDRTHAEARELGATRVFDKPFDLDEFRRVVREMVEV